MKSELVFEREVVLELQFSPLVENLRSEFLST